MHDSSFALTEHKLQNTNIMYQLYFIKRTTFL